MTLSEPNKQKIVEAILAYAQAVKSDPSIAACSMCDGEGKFRFDEVITCPRCEGTGKCGRSFAIVLEESTGG